MSFAFDLTRLNLLFFATPHAEVKTSSLLRFGNCGFSPGVNLPLSFSTFRLWLRRTSWHGQVLMIHTTQKLDGLIPVGWSGWTSFQVGASIRRLEILWLLQVVLCDGSCPFTFSLIVLL